MGHTIKVSVSYYETFFARITNDTGGQFVATGGLTGGSSTTDGLETSGLGATLGGSATTSRKVANVPDEGKASFTILASDNDLVASVFITDGDYLAQNNIVDSQGNDSLVSFQWQVSDNGGGGWRDVEGATSATLDLLDGESRYYRVLASYAETEGDDSDDAPQEEIASQVIRAGDISGDTGNPDPAAPEVRGSPYPGGTLTVITASESGDTDNGRGLSSVQWQLRVVDFKARRTPPMTKHTGETFPAPPAPASA